MVFSSWASRQIPLPLRTGPVLMNSKVSSFGSVAIRVALISPLIGAWIIVHPQPIYACSCVPPDPPADALAKSAVVFMGTAVSVREFERDDGLLSSADPTTVEFDVKTVWRGSVSQTVYLTTHRSDASCGFPFVEGVTYVVYSRDGLTISLCSRTRELSKATEDLAELGEGYMPAEDPAAPTPDPPGHRSGGCGLSPHTSDISVIGLMAGIAWLALRRRRSDPP